MAPVSANHGRFDRACTLFCLETNDVILPFLDENATHLARSISGGKRAWTRIVLRHERATLTLNRLRYSGRGFKGKAGEFNRLSLGTGTFFRDVRVKSPAKPAVREALLQHISNSDVVVGCVGEPAFSVELGHYALLFGLARVARALVFDGAGMLAPDGRLVLDKKGRSGIRIFPKTMLVR